MNKNAYYMGYKLTSMESILTHATKFGETKAVCSDVDGGKSGVHIHEGEIWELSEWPPRSHL